MRKFFESGLAFIIVALLCFLAGAISENGGLFVSIGGFWIVIAAVTNAKFKKESGDSSNDSNNNEK